MIIWISGPYGVGKTTLAELLKVRMGNAVVFDAEAVGNAVRDNYPGCPNGFVFEDYPLWHTFCFQLLKDVHERCQQTILVPMTLVRKESFRIIRRLRRAGIDTKLVILEASHQAVHDRILARGEIESCWCMEQIELSSAGASALPGLHVPTDGKPAAQVCEDVFALISQAE